MLLHSAISHIVNLSRREYSAISQQKSIGIQCSSNTSNTPRKIRL
ncbi:hypothetical protein Anas_14584, partial [Armadillidium nasatum]